MGESLAGSAEAAEILGVSKQRVYQLLHDERPRGDAFPKPVARLRATPVWRVKDLVAFRDRRGTS